MKIRDIVTFFLLFASVSFASAQKVDNSFQLKALKIERKADNLWVRFTADIAPDAAKSNYKLTLTPSLRHGASESKLVPIVVGSRRMHIIDQRLGADTLTHSYATRNGMSVSYDQHIPYAEWMKGASLYINGVSAGCCDSRTLEPLLLAENLVNQKPAPVLPDIISGTSGNGVVSAETKLTAEYPFVSSMTDYSILTEEDIVLSRDKNLIVYFKVNESTVDSGYRENSGEINRLAAALSKINEIPGIKLTKIVVLGFASPDGPLQFNQSLAQQRADGLVNSIVSRTKLSRSYFDIHNGIVAWGKLREYVAASTMSDRGAVLDIIDHTPIWDPTTKVGRQTKLQQLSNGRAYQYMKENFFPHLRTAGIVKVYYEAE